jgi:hypothetical protein
MSSCSSFWVDCLFIVAIRAAMLPNMKAETRAPVIIINELMKVCAGDLGEISLPTILRIE